MLHASLVLKYRPGIDRKENKRGSRRCYQESGKCQIGRDRVHIFSKTYLLVILTVAVMCVRTLFLQSVGLYAAVGKNVHFEQGSIILSLAMAVTDDKIDRLAALLSKKLGSIGGVETHHPALRTLYT